MIYCKLDGDLVYPSMAQAIKITRENPDLTDKGAYTLDVTFPMSILENKVKFRHLNRMEVSMTDNDCGQATIYADNTPIISGLAIVVSVTNEEVKLQIMNENSEFKYASGFDKVYIDEMYNTWLKPWTIFGKALPGNPPTVQGTDLFTLFLMPTIINYDEATKTQNHVGDASIGIYTPIYDETNDMVVNEIIEGKKDGPLLMVNPECQHNLLYIMKRLLALKGYVADLSAVDVYPWNRIYIVNLGSQLPHWTLERFITEFKNLFGLSVRFTNARAIFSWIDFDADAVEYECMDEFSTEFDDEGIQSNSTSNIRYNLFDSSEKTFYTEIPNEIMEKFTVMEYESESAMRLAFDSMLATNIARTIFSTPTGYFYARTEKYYPVQSSDFTLVRAGQFNRLVRNTESDDEEELCIAPVTIAKLDTKFRALALDSDNGWFTNGKFKTIKETKIELIMPTAANDGEESLEHTSVQDAIENGEDASNNERAESERMEVFFLGKSTKNFSALDKTVKMATVGTDPSLDPDFTDNVSFAFGKTKPNTIHIGQFHTKGNRINGKNQRCIKFFCDEMPDPTKLYIFRNKKYICEKIEIQVTEQGIDKVKTGYFYEIL